MAINLLPQNLQKAQKHHNYKLISVSLSLVLLISLVATTAGLFAYRYTVTKQYQSIDKQASDLVAQIDTKKTEEWYLRSITQKSKTAREFIDKRINYDQIIERLVQSVGDTMTIGDLSLKDDGTLILSGSTEKLSQLATYLKNLAEDTDTFAKPQITGLRFSDKDYTYGFDISIKLASETKEGNN